MNMQELKNRLMAQIGKSDPKATQTVDQILEELGKATSEEVRRVLNEVPIHDDMFMGDIRHTNPSEETIKFGPTQAASGGGAQKMIGEFSNVAPQYGITNLYNEFSRRLDSLRKSVITLSEAVKAQNAVISHVMTKSRESELSTCPVLSDEVSKAKELIKKSKSLILKSELYGIEDTSFEDIMEDIRKADLLLKKAKSLLIKAEEEEKKEEEEEVEKSLIDVKKFSTRLNKAKEEIEGKKKEEEDKEMKAKKAEEEDKEKKAKKAEDEDKKKKEEEESAKAKTDAHGNQKDGANKDGNQKDAAIKSADPIDTNVLVKKTVSEVMDIISNSSKFGKSVPNLSKAQTEDFIVAKSVQIEAALDAGLLSGGEEMTARSILSMIELAQKGDLDATIVNNRIMASSSAIQTVFNGN